MVLKNGSATIPIALPQLICFETTIKYSEYHTSCKPPLFWVNKTGYAAFCNDHQHYRVKRKAAKQTPSTYSSLLLPWGTQTAAVAFPEADSLTVKNNHFLPPLTMPYTTSGPFAHGSATSPKYSANCISWKTFTIHFLQVVNLSSDLHPQASDKAFFTGQLLKLIKQWKGRWLFHPRIVISYLFLIPRGRFLFPTSVAGFMHANKRKSGWRTRGSKAKQK